MEKEGGVGCSGLQLSHIATKELRSSCSIFLEFNCDSTGSEDTVPDRRPVGGYGVTPCVIHCAAAILSIELISTYAVLEFSREGIFYYVYIATHLHPSCAVNTPDSAIVSTKGVALQAITTQKVRQMQRLGWRHSLKSNKSIDICIRSLSIRAKHYRVQSISRGRRLTKVHYSAM